MRNANSLGTKFKEKEAVTQTQNQILKPTAYLLPRMLRPLGQLTKTWHFLWAFPPLAPPQLHHFQDQAVPSQCLLSRLTEKPRDKRAIEFQMWSCFQHAKKKKSDIKMVPPKECELHSLSEIFLKEDDFSSRYLKLIRYYS